MGLGCVKTPSAKTKRVREWPDRHLSGLLGVTIALWCTFLGDIFVSK